MMYNLYLYTAHTQLRYIEVCSVLDVHKKCAQSNWIEERVGNFCFINFFQISFVIFVWRAENNNWILYNYGIYECYTKYRVYDKSAIDLRANFLSLRSFDINFIPLRHFFLSRKIHQIFNFNLINRFYFTFHIGI